VNLRPRVVPVFDEADGETLLALLNGDLAKHRQQWASFWSLSPPIVNANPSAYGRAIAEVQRLVSDYVDEWIDSGRRRDGSEAPTERNVSTVTNLRIAVEVYSVTGRIVCAFPNDKVPVAELSGWFRAGEDPVSDTVLLRDDPADHAEEEAVRIVTMLLLSQDWRLRLAKCRKCGRYFLLPQRRKEVYENGCFCSTAHNRAVTATKRMRERRSRCYEKQIEHAAVELLRQWNDTTSWYEDVILKRNLVIAVNQGLASNSDRVRDEITINWVTRHRSEIQAKAKEMMHAAR
jgi:hypothetical protein